MNGHDFGHELMSESVSEADSDTDTRFFGTSDTDIGRVMTSDTGSDTYMYENLGHGFGLGHDFGNRSSLVRSSNPTGPAQIQCMDPQITSL